ncbi:unnamed protein product, partial [Mesorhabditis belari]|uniref:Uncharacterized protein n=1 Tax=Mesorhabditis belari TaxID=2138241 RepID=A0AAF3J8I0_9BILA
MAPSILRPLGPFSHRNCRNVPVDASYCLCEYRKEKIEDEELGHRMAQFVIDEINEIFVEFNVTKLCTPLTLEKVEKVEKTRIYEISVKAAPSGGKFSTVLKLVNNGDLQRNGDILRLNSYKKAGDCVASSLPDLRPLCYCREQKMEKSVRRKSRK